MSRCGPGSLCACACVWAVAVPAGRSPWPLVGVARYTADGEAASVHQKAGKGRCAAASLVGPSHEKHPQRPPIPEQKKRVHGMSYGCDKEPSTRITGSHESPGPQDVTAFGDGVFTEVIELK